MFVCVAIVRYLLIFFNIQFPETISNELSEYLLQSELKSSSKSKYKNDEEFEIYTMIDKDIIKSFKENDIDESDEDENNDEHQNMNHTQQCTQQ